MNEAVIYFARVNSSYLEKVCRRAMEGLRDKNLQIIQRPPVESDEMSEDQLRQAMAGADLSVHLLDYEAGYSRQQIEIARELGIPQLIWISDEFEEDDFEGNYAEFLQELETGSRDGADYEFIRASRRVVAERILERIERLQRQKSISTEQQVEIDVLIDSDLKDITLASSLIKLFDTNNIRYEINIPHGDPLQNISLFETKLQQSKKVLLFFGIVEESWVRERLAYITQLIIRHNYRLDCNVYAAPPPKQRLDDWLDSRFATILDNSASPEPDPAVIKTLLNGNTQIANIETKTAQDQDYLTTGQRQRLQQKIREQEKLYKRLSDLFQKLNEEKIVETRSDEKLRLEHRIDEVEKERESVENRITKLERQL